MMPKANVIEDALEKLCKGRGLAMSWEGLNELFGGVYDAGKREGEMQTADADAARWRTIVRHFGSTKARFDCYVSIPQRRSHEYSWKSGECETFQRAVRWRLDCIWTDLTGKADTLPAMVDVLLEKEKTQASGAAPA